MGSDPRRLAICLALTASWHSVRRWSQLANVLPEDIMRDDLAAFWAEIRAGEDVRNRGAALNARHFASQYFVVVAELQRVAGSADERATVAHMQTISRLLVERGWHGLPSTAGTVHADMTRFRAYWPANVAEDGKEAML